MTCSLITISVREVKLEEGEENEWEEEEEEEDKEDKEDKEEEEDDDDDKEAPGDAAAIADAAAMMLQDNSPSACFFFSRFRLLRSFFAPHSNLYWHMTWWWREQCLAGVLSEKACM